MVNKRGKWKIFLIPQELLSHLLLSASSSTLARLCWILGLLVRVFQPIMLVMVMVMVFQPIMLVMVMVMVFQPIMLVMVMVMVFHHTAVSRGWLVKITIYCEACC